MGDYRPVCCSTPECDRYSDVPGPSTRFSSHCPVPNPQPAKTDWHEDDTVVYAIVGCGKAKRELRFEESLTPKHYPARDLYTSTFFSKKWEYAEACDQQMILSAKHGLVPPEEKLAPYELSIADLDEGQLDDLAGEVHQELQEWVHWNQEPDEIHVLAGKRYIEPLQERGVFDVEPAVRFPLQEHDLGGIGEQMSWLGDQSEPVAVTDGGRSLSPATDRDGGGE